MVTALPLLTVLTLIWIYAENQSQENMASHAYDTFWYWIPTLPMLLLFPYALLKFGFWLSLGASVILTISCFGLFALVMKKFGICLL